jgi:hypothetical protein
MFDSYRWRSLADRRRVRLLWKRGHDPLPAGERAAKIGRRTTLGASTEKSLICFERAVVRIPAARWRL